MLYSHERADFETGHTIPGTRNPRAQEDSFLARHSSLSDSGVATRLFVAHKSPAGPVLNGPLTGVLLTIARER
jgi:hypothetical protein